MFTTKTKAAYKAYLFGIFCFLINITIILVKSMKQVVHNKTKNLNLYTPAIFINITN